MGWRMVPRGSPRPDSGDEGGLRRQGDVLQASWKHERRLQQVNKPCQLMC